MTRGATGKAALILLPVLVLAVLAGVIVHQLRNSPMAPVVATPVHTASLPTRHQFYLGVYEDENVHSWSLVSQFGTAAGTKPGIVLYYGDLRSFPAGFAARVHEHGAKPLIQIRPRGQSLQAVASGQDDGEIRRYAARVRSYGHPVIIGFGHEMNGPWYPWGYRHEPASAFVAAWRHIVTVFRQQGAGNVTWLWTISRDGPATGPLRDWWPGASYVTWIGLDGYYFQRSDTFHVVFGHTVTAIRRFTSKPILISEAAVGPRAGQVAKLPGLFNGISRHHLLGLIWFDVAQHRPPYHQDWRLEDTPAALAVFRREAAQYR